MNFVRLNDPDWEKHAPIFNELLGELETLINRCEGMPLALIEKELSDRDPRIRKRSAWVNLLYGPREIYVEDGTLLCDLRGVVYTPILRKEGERLHIEL